MTLADLIAPANCEPAAVLADFAATCLFLGELLKLLKVVHTHVTVTFMSSPAVIEYLTSTGRIPFV